MDAFETSTVAIDACNLTKSFGSLTAVDTVSFQVKKGEIFGIVGPDGAGKTTTLRMIAGLEMATQGKILIGDRDVTQLPATDRDVSMVFQSYALFPHMSVLENVSYGLNFSGFSKQHTSDFLVDFTSALAQAWFQYLVFYLVFFIVKLKVTLPHVHV